MRAAAALGLGILLSSTPVLATSKNDCYQTSRKLVFDLFEGRYESLGTPPDGGWTRWLAAEFPSDSAFKTFAVVEEENLNPGCQARIRLETVSGRVFALFIDLDGRLAPTGLRSLRELLAHRADELKAAVEDLRGALPHVATGSVVEATVIPMLKRVRAVARDSDEDISNFIVTLEGQQASLPRRPRPLFGGTKANH